MSIACHSLATFSGCNGRMLYFNPQADQPSDEEKKKKKKDKVRSAWISFVGRIVAQIIGAAASIVFGVMILHKYQGSQGGGGKSASGVAVVQAAADRSAPVRARRHSG